MSAVPAPHAGRTGSALRVAVVTVAWLAVVVAMELVCRPWPGTEVLVPVVVAVAVAAVAAVGRPVGGTLLLSSTAILAITVWGSVGGAVLIVSSVTAVVLLPVHAVHPRPK
ncbi:hypothetical protein [Nonomuraea rhizosphaerae]|uniref:hypothetical protein n=1 Tax=Nonomuraea rhizosphaerae TaxID=2665663 RepID=UPI001C6012E6|nr:hypothetical protein [Nonomuraea rhizosphaerae]